MKQRWLEWAEIFDSWRVVPRMVIFAYGYWVERVTGQTLTWYFTMPPADRTGQVTAFVTVVLPLVFGLACWVFKVYSDGGRDWDAKAQGDKP